MPDTRPDAADVRAVVVTACPLLAEHLTGLHTGVYSALLTRIAGIGTLPDSDALLLLAHHSGPTEPPETLAERLNTTTLYIGTDLDDAGVWARAVKLRADDVLFVPGDDKKLTARLAQHLGTRA